MGLSLRGQTSGAVDINAPDVAGDNTITLPGGNGSANQFYKNSTTAGIVTHSLMVEDASGNITIGGTFSLGSGTSISSPSDNVLTLGTNNTEALRITSTGGIGVNTTTVPAGVNVAVGGTIRVQDTTDATQYLTITHQGVDFQNTGAGSSTTVQGHLLDDYERGIWTATIATGGSDISSGSTRYIKIGRQVTVWGRVSSLDTPNASNVTIRLPFAASSGVGDTPEAVGTAMINNVNLDNGASKTYLVTYVGGNNMTFYQCGDNVGWDPLQGTEMTTNGIIIFTLTYYTEE
jgi:hypothetical protein